MSATHINRPDGQTDWVSSLERRGQDLLPTLRSLQLERLQRFPPPTRGGLPLGNEWRVLRRYLAGQSSLLDPSGFSRVYRAFLTPELAKLYRAFVLNEALPTADWVNWLGEGGTTSWLEEHLLGRTETGHLQSRFRAIALRGLMFLSDPFESTWAHHIHLGQDALNLVDFIANQLLPAPGRRLDVGTGSGVILLATGRSEEELVGVDISPRAVRLTRLNAALNGMRCEIHEGDVFEAPDLGSFDLVTWNTPFVFAPDEYRDTSLDGYGGGEFGTAIAVRFFQHLSNLLSDRGVAILGCLGPVLNSGTRVLDRAITEHAVAEGLDVDLHVVQHSWHSGFWDFHRQNGVDFFETVMLRAARGRGVVRRFERAVPRRVVDGVRGRLYQLKHTPGLQRRRSA